MWPPGGGPAPEGLPEARGGPGWVGRGGLGLRRHPSLRGRPGPAGPVEREGKAGTQHPGSRAAADCPWTRHLRQLRGEF